MTEPFNLPNASELEFTNAGKFKKRESAPQRSEQDIEAEAIRLYHDLGPKIAAQFNGTTAILLSCPYSVAAKKYAIENYFEPRGFDCKNVKDTDEDGREVWMLRVSKK